MGKQITEKARFRKNDKTVSMTLDQSGGRMGDLRTGYSKALIRLEESTTSATLTTAGPGVES